MLTLNRLKFVTHNQNVKWIREPVALFACAKNPPEPLTSYVWRYSARRNVK